MSFDLGVIFPDPTTQAALADAEVSDFPDGEVITKILRDNAGYAWKGLEKLLQTIVIELFSDPLVDGTGAGLNQIFRDVRDVTATNVRSLVTRRVEIARVNIIKAQAERGPSLALDEILTGLSVVEVSLIDDAVAVDLLVETGAGEEIVFTSAFRFV